MVSILLEKLGVDRPVLYVLLSRVVMVFFSVITIFFVSVFLTSVEQGYYYTFSSVLGLQVIFELGFSSVLVQFVSHEMEGYRDWETDRKSVV